MKDFEERFSKIKYQIVKEFYWLLMALGFISLSVYTASTVSGGFSDDFWVVVTSILIYNLIVGFFLYLLSEENTRYYYYFLIIFCLFSYILYVERYGVFSTLSVPIATLSLIFAIILGNKKVFIATVSTVLISSLAVVQIHNFYDLSIVEDYSSNNWGDVIVALFYILVIARLLYLAFSQIYKSYSQALEYSMELRKLNEKLDERVKQKTKLLEKSMKKQIDTMYTDAIMGSVTKNLLHDLATPISVLKGLITTDNKKLNQERLDIISESLDEMQLLISESRDLISGKEVEKCISVNNRIKKSVLLVESELFRNEIELEQDIDPNLCISAAPGLFERIILNLLKNAISEFKKLDEEKTTKKIKITAKYNQSSEMIEISVYDNARGIPDFIKEDIFKPYVSGSQESENLGLGLAFVKDTIENKFSGEIKLETEPGNFTEFKLLIPPCDEKSRSKK